MKRRELLALFGQAGAALAQQAQNPSPMVDHSRRHPRLSENAVAGDRHTIDPGTLFLPKKRKLRGTAPLLVHFHGTASIAEACASRLRCAVITVVGRSGSAAYAQPFTDGARFGAMIEEAEAKAGVRFRPLTISHWSAGYGAPREILKQDRYYARVDRLLAIDSIHTGYTNGKPGPVESEIGIDSLDIFVRFARDAIKGRKRMLVTHSEIFPGTFASTTEVADYLVRATGMTRRPVLRWGPMGTQQISEARAGRLRIIGYAGNSAPDHVDQLHALYDLLKMLG
jgi:hypothetical protein